ncbi:Oleandomycin glycosyltransferase [compost metagenome]
MQPCRIYRAYGWQAIINIGDSEDISKDLDIPEHVYLSNHVPQLQILKKADVVVSHGGYGTIKECIAYAVPMAVFPCIYDQPGNAARVQYHQLGIKGDIHRIQPSELTQMIDSLLNNSIYKERITSLREQIRVLNELNHGIERIENALTGSIS